MRESFELQWQPRREKGKGQFGGGGEKEKRQKKNSNTNISVRGFQMPYIGLIFLGLGFVSNPNPNSCIF